jgi:hypothetical protein
MDVENNGKDRKAMDKKKLFGKIIIAYLAVCAAETLLSVVTMLKEKEQPRQLPEAEEKEAE